MPKHDDVVILAAIKAARNVLDQIERDTKKRVLEQMGPGDRRHARIDGADCATITVTAPTDTGLTVTSPREFTEWVKEHRPHAIEERVREVDQRAILAEAVKTMQETGEVPDGVGPARPRRPVVAVRMTDEQSAALEAAFAGGRIVLDDVLAPRAVES